MSEARLLIDSDAFRILAGAGAIDRALALLGFDYEHTFRLHALPYMIGGRSIQGRYPADARQRAQSACLQIGGIVGRPDDGVFERLIAVRDIADGEALLYGLLAERPSYLLATGDKRATEALCSAPSIADIRRAVAGRVICLESILRMMVLRDGVTTVAPRFLPIMDTYGTLEIVFSERNRTDQAECLRALDSYLAALRRQVGEGFLYEP